jgi:hypothetical protein
MSSSSGVTGRWWLPQIDDLRQVGSADRRTPGGLLLARQAYYLIGFDASPETMAWLAQMYRTGRRVVRPARGWSPSWPLARSTASALTRLDIPNPCDDSSPISSATRLASEPT